MIPAVGVTPWFLAGSLFPITLLPAGIEQVSLFLPWTHALALMRYGMMQDIDPGLADIWGMDSNGTMALLSLLALVAYSAVTLFVAIRVFYRKSTS
jgi:ABC-type polysaccharide/polyol phosphate export permease